MRVLKIQQNIKTEFLRKSKKIPEVTCQIRLGRYHTRPIGLTLIRRCGSLAQLVEQLAFNQLVAGSNPARPTIFSRSIPDTWVTFYSEDIGNTFGKKGLTAGAIRSLSPSK
jgi:hypothetical protein